MRNSAASPHLNCWRFLIARPYGRKFSYSTSRHSKGGTQQNCPFGGGFFHPLVLDSQFLGSGTLIRFGETFGILTAEHVIMHPTNKKRRIDTTKESEQRLLVAVSGAAHALEINCNSLELRATARQSDEYGPDLGFIKLPVGGFLEEIAARKSFLNVAFDMEGRFQKAMSNKGGMVFVGFPAADIVEGGEDGNFEQVNGLIGSGFVTAQDKYFEKDGFDYIEVGVSRKGGEAPPSFKGVSGGGLWRAPVIKRKDDPEGRILFGEPHLAGVVFYESDPVEYQTVRAHGPCSLYKWFFPGLMDALS